MELVVGQRRPEPGDRLQLVQRAAGVAESPAGQLRHGRAAGRDQRSERQRDLVADAAGGVLVHRRVCPPRTGPAAPRERSSRRSTGRSPGALMPRSRIAMASADICSSATSPPGVRVDHPVDLRVGQHAAVPLGADDVDRRERLPTGPSRPVPVRPPVAALRLPPRRSHGADGPGPEVARRRPRRPGASAPGPRRTASATSSRSAPPPGCRLGSPACPADRSQYAVQTCWPAEMSGWTKTVPRPASRGEPGRHRGGGVRRNGSIWRGRRAPKACGSSSAIGSGPAGASTRQSGAAVLPQQLPAPAARHQRVAGPVHTGRPRPADRRRWRAARRPRRTRRRAPRRTRRSPRCSRPRSGRRRPARPPRPESWSTARRRASSPRSRHASGAASPLSPSSAQPLPRWNGMPSAAGGLSLCDARARTTSVVRCGAK